MDRYLVYDNFEELGLGDDLAFDICAVDDEDDGIGAGVVGGPDAADSFLAAEIPDAEFDVFMGDLLDVAADGGGGFNSFPQ